MEFAVNYCGKKVGRCSVWDRGLYWKIECSFTMEAHKPMRLFGGGRSLGLPVRWGEKWCLDKTLSKSSAPGFPPEDGVFYIFDAEPAEIMVHGYRMSGYPDQSEGQLLFRIPGPADDPHPCMALVCFFSYQDGFWTLKLNETGEPCF